ncbi:MAG: type II CAAX endopeptidase family protein [Desulfobacterales bacterium]
MKSEKAAISTRVLVGSAAAMLGLEAAYAVLTAAAPANRMLFLGLTRLLQTGALIGVVAWLGSGPAAVGLEKRTFFRGAAKGLLWSAGFGAAALVVLGLLWAAGIDVRSLLYTRLPAGAKDLILFLGVGGLVAPVAEEVFFRGILYGFFRRWGVVAALVVSTGLFAAAHFLKGSFPATQLVGGILFAAAYEVEGSLAAPIVIHVLGNLAIFAVSMMI